MEEKTLNVDIYTICWNEMQLAPFIVDYWKRVARHVYVYDNGSDDGTVEYLSQFDWITVKHFDSDGFNDKIHRDIKNSCWKKSDADWVWVSDFDEVVYADNFFEKLNEIDKAGYTIIKSQWIEVESRTNVPEYQEGKLLHELVDGGFINSKSKTLMFKPSKIEEINYSPGAHFCWPWGIIKKSNELNTIHFKELGIDYVLNRYSTYRNRLSPINIRRKWGIQYTWEEEKLLKDMSDRYKKINPTKDLLI